MNLDDQLRSAAADVRSELDSAPTPAFDPPPTTGSRLALVAMVVIGLGGAWLATRSSDDSSEPENVEVEVASVPSTTAPTNPDLEAVIVGGITSIDEVETSPMDRPALADSVPAIEPDFGTSIRRLTGGTDGFVIQPVYSRTQTYNADGSLLLLYRTGSGATGSGATGSGATGSGATGSGATGSGATGSGATESGHIVVDAATGELVNELDLEGRSDIENISWDPLDPDVLVFNRGAELVEVDVRSGEVGFTATFSGCTTIGNGSSAGSTISQTGVVGFLCELADRSRQWLGFDRVNSRTISGDLATNDSAPVPSISGRFFAAVGDEQVVVLDDTLSTVRTVDIEASSFTMAQDRDGNDLLVATVFGGATEPGTILTIDLATGAVEVIIGPATGYPYPPSGTQLSTAATNAPFRVAVSTNTGSTNTGSTNAGSTNTDGASAGVLVNEIMLLDLHGTSSTLSRLAHHRNNGQPIGDWPSTSMVALSPSGDRVLFSSNWGTDSINTYEINLAP